MSPRHVLPEKARGGDTTPTVTKSKLRQYNSGSQIDPLLLRVAYPPLCLGSFKVQAPGRLSLAN